MDKVPFKFGVTDDGKYGYYKAGADSVTPFKEGMEVYEVTSPLNNPTTVSLDEIGFIPKIVTIDDYHSDGLVQGVKFLDGSIVEMIAFINGKYTYINRNLIQADMTDTTITLKSKVASAQRKVVFKLYG